jgi:carboxyl-terminal processing protease
VVGGLGRVQVDTRGEFGGLGIEVTMEEGLIKVIAPIDETPAAKAGIMSNDIITHLDEQPVQGLTLDQAVEKMRGRVNTKIKLKIMRKGQDKPVEVSITRDLIRVRSVRSRLASERRKEKSSHLSLRDDRHASRRGADSGGRLD